MTYSVDFRTCVMDNIEAGMTWKNATETFGISKRTLQRWNRMLTTRQTLEDAPRRPGKVRKIDSNKLLKALELTPDATLKELAAEFDCWPHAVHRRLKKLNITRKKNHALSRAKS